MTVLSVQQMGDYLAQAGFPPSQIPKGIAVGLAESSGRTDATNLNRNGTIDRGWLQVNSIHPYTESCLFDPLCCAKAGHDIWQQAGGSWSPWSTNFISGKFMGQASVWRPGAAGASSSSGVAEPVFMAAPVDFTSGFAAGFGTLAKTVGGLLLLLLGLVVLGVELPAQLSQKGALAKAAKKVKA